MKIGNILNNDRVKALENSSNAYILSESKLKNNASAQNMSKVVFPEPYENAGTHYDKHNFNIPTHETPEQNARPPQQNQPIFDIKSLLPMLMSGKFDMLKPLMSMFGGGGTDANSGLGNISKIFELFKPKSKPQKEKDIKEEDISSKFDDMIIIED